MNILLLIMALLVIPVIAEDTPINIGITGGMSMAGINGSMMEAVEAKYDNYPVPRWFGAGGFRIGYSLFRFLELESGLYLLGNGFEIFLDGATTDIDVSYTLPRITEKNIYLVRRITTLDIPYSLKFRTPFSPKRHLNFYISAGLRTGLVVKAVDQLVGETATGTIVDENYSTERETLEEINLFKDRMIVDRDGKNINYSYDDFYRRFNLSWQVGLGIEKRLRSISIFLQYQIYQGFLNFNKVPNNAQDELSDPGNESTPDILNFQKTTAYFRGVNISLGITFFIPKQNGP